MPALSRTAILGAVLGVLAAVTVSSPAQASQPLRDHASAQDFIIGTAVATSPLSGEASYRTIAAREFNQLTAENAMKWDATEPNQGQFNFSGADQIMTFARANNQTVHGHTLVWHSQTPSWVQNLGASQMRAAMQNHIATVVGRYAGEIVSWDVVNEVFDDNGGMRSSFWYNTLGQSFIADAFRYADAADPDALLCINDYNVEGINAKSNAMYNLVRTLLSQGVPIDCVGFQGHLATQYGFPNDLQQNIQRFADLGLKVKITELDVRLQMPADSGKLATQATYYRNVFNACLAVRPACLGVTIWGFTDKYSWVPDTFPGEGAALIYDQNYNTKPAYNTIHDVLEAGDTGGGEDDTIPPTTPGQPAVSNVTPASATLTWSASTDSGGSGLAGYTVFQELGDQDTLLRQVTTNSVTLTGLSPATEYQIYVRAEDRAGNTSGISPLATFTTLPGDGGTDSTCAVTYNATNWSGTNGFTANIAVRNTGSSAIDGWTLEFDLPDGQRISEGWGATWSQPEGSNTVTATNASWNGLIRAGDAVGIGFNGTHDGTNSAPAVFNVNGMTCSTE